STHSGRHRGFRFTNPNIISRQVRASWRADSPLGSGPEGVVRLMMPPWPLSPGGGRDSFPARAVERAVLDRLGELGRAGALARGVAVKAARAGVRCLFAV